MFKDDHFDQIYLLDKGWDYGYRQNSLKKGFLTGEYLKKHHKNISKISKELKNNLPKKITELELIFKKILNVEED